MELVQLTERLAGAVEVYDDAVPNVSEILEVLASSGAWDRAKTGAGSGEVSDKRTNDVTWIEPFNFRTPLILHEFVRNVWHYLDDYGLRYDQSFSFLENVNVNRYEPGQQYHVHSDAGGTSTRVISALVYLNDDFTGGETEFVLFGEKVQPKAGRLVIFPSNYAYAHAALPPTDGVKYSAAFWTNR